MPLRIKNWKLAILAWVLIGFFISLGCWQLSRSEQKKSLLDSFDKRTQANPLLASDLKPNHDLRFYRVKLQGHFDNEHTLLLDNKTSHGQVGYEVYTPFLPKGSNTPLLIDRGFLPLKGRNRALTTPVKAVEGEVTITGMLNLPPAYVALGKISDPGSRKPLRVQYINTRELSDILGYSLFSYIVSIEPSHPAAYAMEWQIVIMPPEKHMGYAVQWFALALTLLILFVVLNCRLERPSK